MKIRNRKLSLESIGTLESYSLNNKGDDGRYYQYNLTSGKTSNRGITLVALVVTIVVLLILAGITLTYVLGDNGIIKLAQQAKNETEAGMQKEQDELGNLVNMLKEEYGNGGGSTNPPDELDYPEAWDLDKVTPVKSADDKVVPVPKGFTASEVNRNVGDKQEIENTVDGGFVIYQNVTENDEDELNKINNDNVDSSNARKTRNQFVWVPYSEFKDECPMFTTNSDGEVQGQPYRHSSTSSYPPKAGPDGSDKRMEPGSGYFNAKGKYDDGYQLSDITSAGIKVDSIAQFDEQLKDEFMKMKESVEKYGGFYIGRYETGGLNTAKAKSVQGEGDDSINKQSWFVQYQKNKEMTIGTGAASTLIWGTQWDATLNWFLKQDTEKLAFLNQKSGKGHYTTPKDGVIPTGTNENYKVNNIYDLYGNVGEWTMQPVELVSKYSRIVRGGFYNEHLSDRRDI
ncbi:MAG: hypothetical protein HFJ30_06950 [Clostridia bacterium]|nr:hypothetical protein [Clostridia bacterium]